MWSEKWKKKVLPKGTSTTRKPSSSSKPKTASTNFYYDHKERSPMLSSEESIMVKLNYQEDESNHGEKSEVEKQLSPSALLGGLACLLLLLTLCSFAAVARKKAENSPKKWFNEWKRRHEVDHDLHFSTSTFSVVPSFFLPVDDDEGQFSRRKTSSDDTKEVSFYQNADVLNEEVVRREEEDESSSEGPLRLSPDIILSTSREDNSTSLR